MLEEEQNMETRSGEMSVNKDDALKVKLGRQIKPNWAEPFHFYLEVRCFTLLQRVNSWVTWLQ